MTTDTAPSGRRGRLAGWITGWIIRVPPWTVRLGAVAALDLCTGLPAGKKHHHLQPKVGHYGVFNGRRWRGEIYPKVRDFIAANE